ncbi:MAG TPA: transglutaminase family protein [Acidimicrobiales bacterium]|nr:transglutaminase family protein [Acidimicrobiales bacterium]
MSDTADVCDPDEGLLLDLTVHCEIRFEVVQPGRLVFAIAPAESAGPPRREALTVIGASGPVAVEEIAAPHRARLHLHAFDVGPVTVTYDAEIDRASATPGATADPFEVLLFGRPSRYCPSDHLGGFAVAEFGVAGPALERTGAIVDWITQRVAYLAGASTVHDSAEDTLLTAAGTCRDFAHLGIALCRAVDIPARFASVYAPGISPMDFHAVFEVFDGGRWWLFDATHRAPRQSMSRIATGRDAADTAFATVPEGVADLEALTVLATVDGSLPIEDRAAMIELP